MLRFRDILTIAVLIGLLGVSAYAGWQVYRQGISHPSAAKRSELRDWLSQRDIRSEPHDVKLEMAARLESDFRRGVDWQHELKTLNDAEWARFEENFAELMRVWLFAKVDAYYETPEVNRQAFLDREVSGIMSWRMIDRALATDEDNEQAQQRSASLIELLVNRVQSWVERASPHEQVLLVRFLTDLQARASAQSLQPWSELDR